MSQILAKTIIKLMTSSLVYLFFVLGVKLQVLTNFSIFRGIKLKLSVEVNSETLISYFMSVFSIQREFDKTKGVLCRFFTEFILPFRINNYTDLD